MTTQHPIGEVRSFVATALLLRAYRHSLDSQCDTWRYAIGVRELRSLGLHDVDLTWLLNKGFAEQALDTTVPGDLDRCFRRLTTRIISPRAYLVLTPAGYSAFEQLQASPATNADSPDVKEQDHSSKLNGSAGPLAASTPLQSGNDRDTTPVWDSSQRELLFRGQLVKRYRVPAPNQERILSAFEEEGWPHGIDDPLPPEADQDPIRRLQATVKSLNRNQCQAVVRFRGNGNGDRVCWEEIA